MFPLLSEAQALIPPDRRVGVSHAQDRDDFDLHAGMISRPAERGARHGSGPVPDPEQLATPLMKRPYDLRHAGIVWRLTVTPGCPPPRSLNGPVTASKY
jgi:hypothetical protein